MNNPHYKKFINILNDSIRSKKKDPTSKYHRFIQQDEKKEENINFSTIFDEKERKRISQNFFDTISSDKFVNEVKTQYDQYNKSDAQKIYKQVSDFYIHEDELAQKDKKSQELSSRFIDSVHKFIDNHKEEYKQEGIVTVEGSISNNPGEYINKETNTLKEHYEENYSIEDIDKIMKLDKII